jgi:hypothetical protein
MDKNGGFLHGFNQTWGFMIAKLVSTQVNGWVYGRYIKLVHGVYKRTYKLGVRRIGNLGGGLLKG